MKHEPIKNRCCLNEKCSDLGKFGEGNIIRHSMYKTKQGRRRTACHARDASLFMYNIELQRCYYNFIRQHSALKFGKEIRTPAMQAGLVKKQLSFRDIFMDLKIIFLLLFLRVKFWYQYMLFLDKFRRQQHFPEHAPEKAVEFFFLLL